MGPLRYCIKLGAKRVECGALAAKVRATKSHRNFSQRTHPIHPIGPKTTVSVHFVVFGCIWDRFRDCMKLVAKHIKLVQLIQKFVAGSHVVIDRNERT